MMGRLQVEQAELAAEQSRLDAERQRLRATQLEQEQLLLRAQAAEWVRAAREDTLTGLGNRRVVDEAFPACWPAPMPSSCRCRSRWPM